MKEANERLCFSTRPSVGGWPVGGRVSSPSPGPLFPLTTEPPGEAWSGDSWPGERFQLASTPASGWTELSWPQCSCLQHQAHLCPGAMASWAAAGAGRSIGASDSLTALWPVPGSSSCSYRVVGGVSSPPALKKPPQRGNTLHPAKGLGTHPK